MSLPSKTTAGPDDVAWAAVAGAVPMTLAVCQDPAAATQLVTWLRHAVPNLSDSTVAQVPAARLLGQVDTWQLPSDPTVVLVPDAADGSSTEVPQRWSEWNVSRDRVLNALRCAPSRRSLVLVATQARMPEISLAAPDILSVAQVITVSDEPFAVDANDEEVVQTYRKARDELESRHGFKTSEFIRKLQRREEHGIDLVDSKRWQAIAEALREIDS